MPDAIDALATQPFWPTRRATTLGIDEATIVKSVIDRAKSILTDMDRGKWMQGRLERYAKYRGWLGKKTYPWLNCSNVHLSILQIAELRANAGIHNVVMSLRPLMTAKATSRVNVAKEDTITNLIDAQLFIDPGPAHAERSASDYISDALQDGNAVALTAWARDERQLTRLVRRPPPTEGVPPEAYLQEVLFGPSPETPGLFPPGSTIEKDPTITNRYFVTYLERQREQVAMVTVWQDADGLELDITREVMVFDGPTYRVIPIDKLLIPTRCSNLQPPTEYNAEGAPYVFIELEYTLNELRADLAETTPSRRRFRRLTADKLKDITAKARANRGMPASPMTTQDQLQAQKDTMEGRTHQIPQSIIEEDDGYLPVTCLIAFDQWDVDGDTRVEDVVWVIAKDASNDQGVLLDGRLLTEEWPADRPYRPLAECCPIPVPHRWYGISMLELGEALSDLIKGTFDLTFDSASVTAFPFGFYNPSNKLTTDILKIAPLTLIPIPGDPKTTVYFPPIPQRDQSWGLGVISLAYQFVERLLPSASDLAGGRVPQGKASALRTMGTTVALLQQGDVRADQLLLRVFNGFSQIALHYHRMNRHFLSPGKEIRILGWNGKKEQGYQVIDSLDEIDAEAQFEFRPDFLLSNPAMQAQAIQDVLTVIATPIASMMKISTPEHFYQALEDFIRARRLDPKKYIQPPPRQMGTPLIADEAIAMIVHGIRPQGWPMEGAPAHMQKLIEFRQAAAFGALEPPQVEFFNQWVSNVRAAMEQERMAQAAQAFQQMMIQQGAGATMPNTQAGEPPQLGAGAAVPTGAGEINA